MSRVWPSTAWRCATGGSSRWPSPPPSICTPRQTLALASQTPTPTPRAPSRGGRSAATLRGALTRLAVSEHVTILSDPAGQSAPSLSLHVSADAAWQAAYWTGGVAIAFLAVAAWTAPRPARYRSGGLS
jgi:hypothetical protein